MKRTLQETAGCLDIPADTLERWIRQGRIPVHKSGDTCIFKAEDLKKWADKRNLKFDPGRKPTIVAPCLEPDSLLAAMQRGDVHHEVPGRLMDEVLASAVKRLAFLSEGQQQALIKTLLEREEMASTGIGKGVAIPHPRSPLEDGIRDATIATCFLQRPVDFSSVDDKPVFVLFILMSTSIKDHLHLLSRLSFCVRETAFIDFLKKAPGREELFAEIALFEARLEQSEGNRLAGE